MNKAELEVETADLKILAKLFFRIWSRVVFERCISKTMVNLAYF